MIGKYLQIDEHGVTTGPEFHLQHCDQPLADFLTLFVYALRGKDDTSININKDVTHSSLWVEIMLRNIFLVR